MSPSFVAAILSNTAATLLERVGAVNQPEGWSINERDGLRAEKPL
jgi:hypothetical protein